MTHPVIRAPDCLREFTSVTDASNTGLRAMLSQKDNDGEHHLVTYLRENLQAGEEQLSSGEGECLAILHSLRKLGPYVWGGHFVLCTDHSPLLWLRTIKANNSKLMRWALILQDFDFEVQVIKGTQNCTADALSRRTED